VPADTFFDEVSFIEAPEFSLIEHHDIFVRSDAHASSRPAKHWPSFEC
jgi:hypothetical protein